MQYEVFCSMAVILHHYFVIVDKMYFGAEHPGRIDRKIFNSYLCRKPTKIAHAHIHTHTQQCTISTFSLTELLNKLSTKYTFFLACGCIKEQTGTDVTSSDSSDKSQQLCHDNKVLPEAGAAVLRCPDLPVDGTVGWVWYL